MRAVQSKLRSVERSKLNTGHFGGHIEYANETNLHNFLADPHRDTYENLRLLRCKLLTAGTGLCNLIRPFWWPFWRPF